MIERLIILAAFMLGTPALALPLYAARSGRTCDNCHSLPNTWLDPAAVADRKCTLSCVGCHVDPNGGGLRTVSGRYFGDVTLPMFNAADRPLADMGRHLFESMNTVAPGSQPSSQPSSQPASGPIKPADRQVDPRPPGSPPATDGWQAMGDPAGHAPDSTAWRMGWLNGRYGNERADPLLLVGADARMALWFLGLAVFPMQADVYAALHPVDHLTFATTVGARGRRNSRTFASEPELDEQSPVAMKDLYLMVHELPYMAYARVGRFMPAFGTRIADHTAYIRRPFGLSQENPNTRVLGVEAGIAPNYPHVTASVFKPSTLDANNPVEPGEGWGAALQGGWRDLGWQLGASGMIRRRPLALEGDTLDAAIHGAFNPWFYWKNIPLTWLAEVTIGRYQRPFSGKQTARIAMYHQLAWTAWNGLIFRARYDAFDPDFEVIDDHIHRPGLGLDWTIMPGLTLNLDLRVGFPAKGELGEPPFDGLLQLHGWL